MLKVVRSNVKITVNFPEKAQQFTVRRRNFKYMLKIVLVAATCDFHFILINFILKKNKKNIVSQFQSSTFGQNYNAPCSAVSLR